MIYQTPAILTACFILCMHTIYAQQVSKVNTIPSHVSLERKYQQYDSLGDHYLFIQDTCMAISCYQKAVDADTAKTDQRKSLEKLKRCYSKSAQSFYLKEY